MSDESYTLNQIRSMERQIDMLKSRAAKAEAACMMLQLAWDRYIADDTNVNELVVELSNLFNNPDPSAKVRDVVEAAYGENEAEDAYERSRKTDGGASGHGKSVGHDEAIGRVMAYERRYRAVRALRGEEGGGSAEV